MRSAPARRRPFLSFLAPSTRGARLRRCALASAALLLSTPLPFATAEDAAAPAKKEEAKKDESSETKLSPEVEKTLAELLDKITEAKRKTWSAHMKEETGAVQKATGLNADGVKALEAAATKAVAASCEDLPKKLDAMFRKEAKQMPAQIVTQLKQALLQVDMIAASEEAAPGVTDPTDQPAWTDAIKSTLNADQTTAWNKVLADRNDTVNKEMGDLVKGMKEQIRTGYEQQIANKIAGIERTLGPLPKERTDQLEAMSKEAVSKTVETWEKSAEKFLLSMSAAQRKQMKAQRGFFFSGDQENTPDKQEVWTEGLKKLLSDDERKKLETAASEHKDRRARIFGRVMLCMLDERIAFTAKQRDQLKSIAERLVKGEESLFPTDDGNNFNNFGTNIFFSAAQKAKPEELELILDAAQRKHWQETSAGNAAAPDSDDDSDGKLDEIKIDDPSDLPEPEEVEKQVSNFLVKMSANERERQFGVMLLKAEDAARVGKLNDEATNRLQTAARGAAERSLENWENSMSQMVRSNIGDASPRTIRQRLSGMSNNYNFRFQRNGGPSIDSPIFDKAADTEMTTDQRAAWKTEIDARKTFVDDTAVSAVMVEFDRLTSLSQEQWDKIQPLVQKVTTDYLPDIQNYFSFGNGAPWYLQYYSKFIPLCGIPEKDLKEILTKDQWDHWSGSNELSFSKNYWENLQRNHEQRAKNDKATKK